MLPIVRILRGQFVLAIVLGLLTGPMVGCISKLEGVDFDDKLMLKEDGLVYRKGDDKPFTGKAYDSVCGYGCMPFIHWQGEFKDGKKHGTFIFPESRKADGFFHPDDKIVIRVKFVEGIEVDEER